MEITFGDVVHAAWRKLREMRTVFQLLGVLAVGTLICTIIPQNQPPEHYAERYGLFLANVIVGLQLDHVQSAFWFQVLWAILLLSLAACSRRLWQEGAGRWRAPEAASAAQRVERAERLATARFSAGETLDKVNDIIRHRRFSATALGADGERMLTYVCKHRWSAWGQTLAHYAVFLIALGSVMGSLPGLSVDQNVQIQEGDTYHAEDHSLPFAIKVNSFRIEHHAESGAVDNYYSDVTLLEGDQAVHRGTLYVNRPLKYRGYYLSQADWSLGEARLEVTRAGQTETIRFPLIRGGSPELGLPDAWGVPHEAAAAFMAGGKAALVATGFYADAKRERGEVVGSSSEYLGEPAINLMYVSGLPGQKPQGGTHGKPGHGVRDLGWLFMGETKPLGDAIVKFTVVTKATGLGIRKDVGLPLVFTGFIACMVGLSLIFYLPLQRAVLGVEAGGDGRSTVRLAAYGRGGDVSDGTQGLWDEIVRKLDATPVAPEAAQTEEE